MRTSTSLFICSIFMIPQIGFADLTTGPGPGAGGKPAASREEANWRDCVFRIFSGAGPFQLGTPESAAVAARMRAECNIPAHIGLNQGQCSPKATKDIDSCIYNREITRLQKEADARAAKEPVKTKAADAGKSETTN